MTFNPPPSDLPLMKTSICEVIWLGLPEVVPTDVRDINIRPCTSDSWWIYCLVRLLPEHRPLFVWDVLLRPPLLNTLLHQGGPIYTLLMLFTPVSVILGMVPCTSPTPNKTGRKAIKSRARVTPQL